MCTCWPFRISRAWIVRDSMLTGYPEGEMVQGFAQWYMQSTLNADMFLNLAIWACEMVQTSCTDLAPYSRWAGSLTLQNWLRMRSRQRKSQKPVHLPLRLLHQPKAQFNCFRQAQSRSSSSAEVQVQSACIWKQWDCNSNEHEPVDVI